MSEWAESSVSEAGCRALVELGYMPEKPSIGWRPAYGEPAPRPGAGEAVVFAPFFERGFSVPTHPFFRRILRHYGLQLHHLNPNGILHISIFITLCEAYLGIEPHFGLWKWLYCVKPKPVTVSKRDPNNACAGGGAGAIGGASIQLRPKVPYVSIPLGMSKKGWQSRWFYCRNEKPTLPEFVAGRCPVKLPSWSDPPTADEMAEVEKIMPHLNGLIRNGLDGAHLVATFLSRRIQPIKKRCHRMSEFTGYSDPTRERSTKLSLDEIVSRVDQLVSTDTSICTDGKPLPCHHKRPPENDLSKYLSVTLEEDEEGVDIPSATVAVTIVSQPPLKKGELVQRKGNEVVAHSCSVLAQQRESGNSVTIAHPPPDVEDTETMSHSKKRKSAEALACSTPGPGLQDLSSLGRVEDVSIQTARRKLRTMEDDSALTSSVTIVSQPPLKKGESVQQKGNEVVAHSCSELAQQRESSDSVTIARPPPDVEDTETMSHLKKRKSAEALACSTPVPGLQDLSSLGRVEVCKRKKKLLSKDVMLPCLLLDSSASPTKEVSASASSQAADLTVPHREEMPEDVSVPLSPPHAASPSPTPQSEPCPLQSPPARHASPTTTLSTLTVPESIEMAHVPCRQPLPCDNLGSSQQSVGFATNSVEVEGELHGKKAEKEPGMLSVQMKDADSKLLCEIDDEQQRVMVDWEKVKEAATFFETRLAEITLRFKCASEQIVKLKQENNELEVKLRQENKDLEVKLRQENKDLEVKLKQESKDLEVKLKQESKDLEVKLKQENKDLEAKLKESKDLAVKLKQENEAARAFEKKASDLSKELDIVRADRDSLSQRFQDAKKKAADLFDAFNAPCDKFSIDNSSPYGVEVVAKRLDNFQLTDTAAAADGGHCSIGMQLALATRG